MSCNKPKTSAGGMHDWINDILTKFPNPIPKHEEYMLIKSDFCKSMPPILMTYPILNSFNDVPLLERYGEELAQAISSHQIIQNVRPPSAYTVKDTEGEIPTGVENVTKRERAAIIPWTYDPNKEPDERGANSTTTPYMHYCNGDSLYKPGEERSYTLRGYFIRRGHSVTDEIKYWCNSCGYTTNDNETTYLDMLAL